jgi:hypothetical protein
MMGGFKPALLVSKHGVVKGSVLASSKGWMMLLAAQLQRKTRREKESERVGREKMLGIYLTRQDEGAFVD